MTTATVEALKEELSNLDEQVSAITKKIDRLNNRLSVIKLLRSHLTEIMFSELPKCNIIDLYDEQSTE